MKKYLSVDQIRKGLVEFSKIMDGDFINEDNVVVSLEEAPDDMIMAIYDSFPKDLKKTVDAIITILSDKKYDA